MANYDIKFDYPYPLHIKTIQIKVISDDYIELIKRKGEKTWYQFLMEK